MSEWAGEPPPTHSAKGYCYAEPEFDLPSVAVTPVAKGQREAEPLAQLGPGTQIRAYIPAPELVLSPADLATILQDGYTLEREFRGGSMATKLLHTELSQAALFVVSLSCLLMAPGSFLGAQAPTGTIQGQVRDQAGGPMAQAQVFIIGTTYGAETDPRGHYFINNIPAGPAAVRAAFVGYRPVEVRDLRVRAGQTVTRTSRSKSPPSNSRASRSSLRRICWSRGTR